MPTWLLPIRHLLFRSPEHAANKMLEIATQPSVFPSGSFVLSGKLKDIPFANCAEAVLSLVRQACSSGRSPCPRGVGDATAGPARHVIDRVSKLVEREKSTWRQPSGSICPL
jgi:hypothetical protein